MRCKAGSSSTTRTHAWRSPLPRKLSHLTMSRPCRPAPELMPATAITPVPGCRIACLLLALVCLDAAIAGGRAIANPRPAPARNRSRQSLPCPSQDTRRLALGERLFSDRRLSHDNTRSCSSCHDIRTNGASSNARDLTPEGRPLALNTPTIFNAALNFRLNWEGNFRTLESQAEQTLRQSTRSWRRVRTKSFASCAPTPKR